MADIEDEIRRIVREEIRAVLDELRGVVPATTGPPAPPPVPGRSELRGLKRLLTAMSSDGEKELPPDPNPNDSEILRRSLTKRFVEK